MGRKAENSSQSWFYWIYLAGFFSIIIQILNVLPFWFIPTDWGKVIIFRIILSILIFFFIFQVLFKKISILSIKEKIKSVRLPLLFLLALFGVYLLATIFSINQHFSLWGDPNRNGGFVNFSFYIFWGILALLIIKKNDWQKILDFLIVVSIFVCIIAFFQKFGIFNRYFISENRPVSVMGNTISLSIYLLLITFLSFSFGITAQNQLRKIFYFFSAFLFFFVAIFLTQTRGTYLGFFIGFLFFLFFYPKKTPKQSLANARDATGQAKLKIYAAVFITIATLGMFSLKVYLDNHLYVYQKLPTLISNPLDRALSLFEGLKIAESRVSVWKVSLNALTEKPFLGWGPENFMVAFDKYYDPSLPRIGHIATSDNLTEWFDRAHNFIFDISITGGIPALIIYLSFFAALIWQLQKVKYYPNTKNSDSNLRMKYESTNNPDIIIIHGLQAAFLGYLVALATGFDSVSTYLVAFLLIGYSLYLISNYNPNLPARQRPEPQALAGGRIKSESTNEKPKVIPHKLYKYRVPIMFVLFVILVWFIWDSNIKPLYVNKEMNLALGYADLRTEKSCEKALSIVDKISPLVPSSIINNYLGQKSTFVLYGCNDKIKSKSPEALIKQDIEILKKNIEQSPQYVTNWILIGEYTSILIKEKNMATENVFAKTEETKKLKEDTDYYFEKALQLSPKRQLILKDWADTNTITAEYQKAEEKLKKCIDLNPTYARCYWYMALNKGYQRDYEGFKEFSMLAKENGLIIESQEFLQESVNMYIRNNNYQGLAEVYPKLISVTPDPLERAQVHASLAATYKELGDIKRAREEVLKIEELIPLLPKESQEAAKNDVEEFLRILGQ